MKVTVYDEHEDESPIGMHRIEFEARDEPNLAIEIDADAFPARANPSRRPGSSRTWPKSSARSQTPTSHDARVPSRRVHGDARIASRDGTASRSRSRAARGVRAVNVSKGSQRVVLQADTEAEEKFLQDITEALAGATDGLAGWTLDRAEYTALDHYREEGAVGEKALVVSWGGIGELDVYDEDVQCGMLFVSISEQVRAGYFDA